MSTTLTDETVYEPDSEVDPKEFIDKSAAYSSALMDQAYSDASKYITALLEGTLGAVKMQMEELKLFRTLEIYIRRGTMTPDILQDTMNKLQAHRRMIKDRIEAVNRASVVNKPEEKKGDANTSISQTLRNMSDNIPERKVN